MVVHSHTHICTSVCQPAVSLTLSPQAVYEQENTLVLNDHHFAVLGSGHCCSSRPWLEFPSTDPNADSATGIQGVHFK